MTDKIRYRDWEEKCPVSFYSHLEQMRGNPAETYSRSMISSGFHTHRGGRSALEGGECTMGPRCLKGPVGRGPRSFCGRLIRAAETTLRLPSPVPCTGRYAMQRDGPPRLMFSWLGAKP